jgi:hypothetical protein
VIITDSKRQIKLELIDEVKYVNCSDVLTLSKYICLETTEECLIGKIDNVLLIDSFLYVLDKDLSKSIYVFDYEGTFLKKLSNEGKGPGEYASLSCMAYDKWTKEILVLDRTGRKLMKFNLKGDILESVGLEDGYSFFRVLDEEKIVFFSNYSSYENKQFSICLKNGQLVRKFWSMPLGQKGYGIMDDIFSKHTDSCIFSIPYDNKI